MATVTVTPASGRDGYWSVQLRSARTFATQEEAIEYGRALSRIQAAELVIHGEDGKIRAKDSHGNDPKDIPG